MSTAGPPGSPGSVVATALRALAIANEAPRGAGPGLATWRWTMRQRVAAVRDALCAEPGRSDVADDGWLAARGGAAFAERNALLMRLGELGSRVIEDADVGAVRAEVARLVADVGHHVQRVHDLAHDRVEMELGGSE
ncbi:hypothetical protein FE634_00570 [Nocardioides dongxiaopingii]|uniref:hypothetical protein n=1 Tax=Nocardioides sp. S-1144 TaxID=2582905 RepID=UPI00110D773A|nr:hypothetical protein [Nocardioides sp. S-1144]QCW49281.1 hypothetical protein FE634_00570 [Nocardioides sp. S-1144]